MATKPTTLEKVDQLVVFRLSDAEYGASSDQIKEIVVLPEITRLPQTPDFIKGVMNLRGQVIAVIGLTRRFGLHENPEKLPEHIIIVESEDYTVGMIVDEVLEVMRISEGTIETTPSLVETNIDNEYVDGIARLDDRLIIVLNLFQVLKAEEAVQLKRVAAGQESQVQESDTANTPQRLAESADRPVDEKDAQSEKNNPDP
ncbi:chemotaxis protein CheW [Acidobacteria bacterium AH-259-A15]|nr:chemotaxis protein CheW [Acidobacteria bacterium AH-259-A15]